MENQTEYKTFNIKEIKDWLRSDNKVQLPAIQRGFVWKTAQMERLWDSIFRGYPIGSAMLTDDNGIYTLLDGQQRTTTIALGFYNPWTEKDVTIGSVKRNLPTIWMDIKPNKKTDTQKYVFRVVTQSHPWGYQLHYSESILSVSDRGKAYQKLCEIYGKKAYTQYTSAERFPYDATLPVPLAFLLEATQTDSPQSHLLNLCQKYLSANLRTKDMPVDTDYFTLLRNTDIDSLFETINAIVLKTKLPAICIPKELILNQEDSTDNDESTLFIRLNSAGTKISGEELMYSIYKSIFPQTKDLVEQAGCNMIAPSRIISLVARLVQSKLQGRYVSSISLGSFRSLVQQAEFREGMVEFIGSKENSLIRTLISDAIRILHYKETPNVIVKEFMKSSPEGMLLLLHWLELHKDVEITESRQKAICARLYRNFWFGDISKLVTQYWDNTSEIDIWNIDIENTDCFFEYPLVPANELENLLLQRVEKGNDYSISPQVQDSSTIWNIWSGNLKRTNENKSEEDYNAYIKERWNDFLYRLLWNWNKNKSFILLAQKEYINQQFREFNQLDDLEDTNRPWDWDHIYPNSWVYYQREIDQRTRDWENSIGNFRAMDLVDNRSENNIYSPAERLKGPNSDYFIRENDWEWWKKLDEDHKYIKEGDEEYVLIHAKAIITRCVNIYANFIDTFFKN